LNIVGTGLANLTSQFVAFVLLIYYTRQQDEIKPALISPDSRIFKHIKEYMALGIPSYIMMASDWWVWEFMILISGWLGVQQQASCIVIMLIVSTAYMVAIGLD